jgi:hypothetical protein
MKMAKIKAQARAFKMAVSFLDINIKLLICLIFIKIKAFLQKLPMDLNGFTYCPGQVF